MADLMETIMNDPIIAAESYSREKNFYKVVKKMIKSPTPEVRIKAFQSLSVLTTPPTIILMLKEYVLKETEDDVRNQIAQSMVKISDMVLEPLIELLLNANLRSYVQDIIDRIGYNEFMECINGVKIVNPDKALYYEIIMRIFHPSLTSWDYSSYDAALHYTREAEATAGVLLKAFGESEVILRKNALLASQIYPQIGKLMEKQIVNATKAPEEEIVKQALETLASIKVPSTVPIISKKLEDSNSNVRMDAARLLGEVKTIEAVGPLIKRLENEDDVEVKQAIEMALGKIGEPAAGPLVAKLRKEENVESIEVALKRIGPPAVKYISDAMSDPNAKIRANATQLSILIYSTAYGFGGTVVRLVELLKDKSKEVREAVIQAIINMGDPAIEYIIESCGNIDENIKSASIEVLNRFSNMNIEMVLDEVRKNKKPIRAAELAMNLAVLLNDEELKDKGFAMLIEISKADPENWKAIIFRLQEMLKIWMRSKDTDIRFSAVQVAQLFGSDIVPELQLVLTKDKDADVQEAAIESLGIIGEQAINTVPEMVKKLKKGDSQIKETIYTALGNIGKYEVLPFLITGLGEIEENLQAVAIEAIQKMGDNAYGALIKSLADKNNLVRETSINLLIEAGDKILTPLIQSMANPDNEFQTAATKIFNNFKEEAAPLLMEGLKTSTTIAQSFIIKNLALLKYEEAIPEIIETIRYGDSAMFQAAADSIQIFGEQAIDRYVELFGFNDPQTLQNVYSIAKLIDPEKIIVKLINQLTDVREPGINFVRKTLKEKNKEILAILTELKQTNPQEVEKIVTILTSDPQLRKIGEKIAKL